MSDSCFGTTDLGGLLPGAIPIHGVLGDSHGALFGTGLPETGTDEDHLWDRLFSYDEYWGNAQAER